MTMNEILKTLTSSNIFDIIEALNGNRISYPFSAIALSRFLPKTLSEDVSIYFNEMFAKGFNEVTLSITLELVAKERENWKNLNGDSVDLVWTGPEVLESTSRDTSVVVRDLFQSAKQEVVLSGYAIYQGLSVFKALADAMDKNENLIVKMYLDVKREYRDTKTENEEILKAFIDRFKNEQWPGKRFPEIYYDPRSLVKDPKNRSCLHAKCVVIDKKVSFVSSANFTEAAQYRNIEAGFLVRSEWLAQKLTAQFHKLSDAGIIKKMNI